MKKVAYLFIIVSLSGWLPVSAQKVSMKLRGETLSEALRQIDQSQHSKRILFLFDDLDMYTVTADIDRLPASEAVRKVCSPFPVSVTEMGNNIFVEYVPKIVHLSPVVVNGERISFPPQLVVDSASSEVTSLQQLARHIAYFNRVCPQEKVYLHLDNTAYFEGETIWFAATVTGSPSLSLEKTGRDVEILSTVPSAAPASKVLYVELLSPTGVVLQQQKLKVVDGRCHGSFPLIDADVEAAVKLRGALPYPSGYYQIRAYTRAMLNFDEACIYSRVIPVYEAPAVEGEYDNPVIAEYDGTEPGRPKLPRSERPDELNVAFFPEGGHLISGVPCRVAFKATDEHGLGIDVDSIVDAEGRIIDVPLIHNGMGAFDITTATGGEELTFYAGDLKHRFSLPASEATGVALLAGDSIALTPSGINETELLAYTLTSGGRVWAFDTLHLSAPRRIAVPCKALPAGVAQFTLFNTSGGVLAQRLLFVGGEVPLMPLHVEAENETLAPFDSVCLHFRSEVPEPCTFSVAVRDPADYGTSYADDIRTYMLLSSELKGLIENPAWYFDNEESNSSKSDALDLLMMVQGWTRYDWEMQAVPGKFAAPTHFTEDQLVLDGWAFSRFLEKPLAGVTMTAKLYSPDHKQVQTATVTTDSLGYWSIGLEDFEGEWDLHLFTKQNRRNADKRTTRVRFERSSFPAVQPFRPEDTFLPEWEGRYPTLFSWDEEEKKREPFIQFFPGWKEEREAEMAFELDEVEILGKRKYIDYYRFRAFDAQRDNEMEVDEGNYTDNVAGYLKKKKGYDVVGDYIVDGSNASSLPGSVMMNGTSLFDPSDLNQMVHYLDMRDNAGRGFFTGYSDHIAVSARVNNHETKWHKKPDDYSKALVPAYLPVWCIDMEYVKSVLVFDYEPGHRYVEVEVELLTPQELKQRTKNYRFTTFAGYSKPVEFYAPTYPSGPIKGDKDFRRTIYWNPEVKTDSQGCATIGFYNNGYSRMLSVSAEGLTDGGVPILNVPE